MRRSVDSLVVLAFLALAGCSSSMSGSWDGVVTCGGIPFEFGFILTGTTNKVFEGDGLKYRSFTNVNGDTTEEFVEFDIIVERLKASGEQELVSDLECTSEDKKLGDTFLDGVECEPQQFRDWVITWDGSETMTIKSSECAGAVVQGAASE